MIDTHSPLYQKAFEQYLRRGTPIDISLKALAAEARETPYYIWRTAGDGKVRASHAANNGRIFAWDNPPDTGHPGEDFGCRCVAVPFYGVDSSGAELLLLLPFFRVCRIAILIAARVLSRVNRRRDRKKPDNYTQHGAKRANERNITEKETAEAIRTAKETGNVSRKIGKYGTPQIHYKGTNGVTVVQETVGRNAGKVITSWRH